MSFSPDKRVIIPRGEPVPPPHPGVRHVRVWRRCTIVADDEVRDQIDRWFHWPMIVLALAVLPLLLIELFYLDAAPERERSWLGVMCWIGLGVIWLAFVTEFIVKVALAESRSEYVRRNWLDIVIILVPALRPLRVTSLVRTSRLFRLRGVGMKLFRAGFAIVVGMEATEHYLQKLGVKRIKGSKPPEQMTRHELMEEVRRLRRRCGAWESWHRAEQDFLAKHDKPAFHSDPPRDDPADAAHATARPYNPVHEDRAGANESSCR